MAANIDLFINAKDQTAAALTSVKSGLLGLGTATNQVSGHFNAMTVAIGTTLGNLATSAITKMSEFATSIVTTGINFNNLKQQADIAFTTMLGSSSKAQSFLNGLKDFAARTPFEFPDLLIASQRMLAMGFESNRVLPTLTAIGDAVAGLGGSSALVDRVTTALGQMQAKGKASAEEMLQLTEAGIPAWQFLADKIGVSIPEAMAMVSKSAISAEVAIGAVVDGMNAKFGGMMEQQSQTFGGLWSTISDTFTMVSGQVMEPLFQQITRGLAMIVAWTNSPQFTAGVAALTGLMQRAGLAAERFFDHIEAGLSPLDALSNGLRLVLPDSLFAVWWHFTEVVKGVSTALNLLATGNYTGGIFGFKADAPFIKALLLARDAGQWLYEQLQKLIGQTWDWAERVLPGVADGLGNFVNFLDKALAAVQTVIRPLTETIGKFITFDDVMAGLAVLLAGPVLAAIGGLLLGLAQFLAPIAAVVAAVAALRWAWENDFLRIQTFTRNSLQRLSTWFFEESGLWKGSFEATLEYLKWWADGGWRNYVYFPIRSWFYEIRSELITWSLYTQNKFAEWQQKISDTIEGWKNDALRIFTNWKDRVLGFFTSTFGPTLKELEDWSSRTTSKVDQWVTYWRNQLGPWKDWVIEKFQAVLDWWDKHVQPFVQRGRDLIDGLRKGMEEKWNNLTTWFSGVWADLTDRFKRFFGIASPSKLMWEYGYNIAAGLQGGIDQGMTEVTSTMRVHAEAISQEMKAAIALSNQRIQEEIDYFTQQAKVKAQAAYYAIANSTKSTSNLVQQLGLDPSLYPESWGGTRKVVGYGPNGELILEGVTTGGGYQGNGAIAPTSKGTSAGSNYVPATTNITTLAEALGLDKLLPKTVQDSTALLGGITLQAPDLAQNKAAAAQVAADSKKLLEEYIAGVGDFLTDTLQGAKSVFGYFDYQENKAYAAGTLKEYVGSETAQTKNQLALLYQGIQASFADILGVSSSALDWNSVNAKQLIDRMGELLQSTNAETNIEHLGKLLQSAVDFRNLANYGSGASYFNEILPSDERLTGPKTTNNTYNITLQGSNNANADVLGLLELLGSLQGTASA